MVLKYRDNIRRIWCRQSVFKRQVLQKKTGMSITDLVASASCNSVVRLWNKRVRIICQTPYTDRRVFCPAKRPYRLWYPLNFLPSGFPWCCWRQRCQSVSYSTEAGHELNWNQFSSVPSWRGQRHTVSQNWRAGNTSSRYSFVTSSLYLVLQGTGSVIHPRT
jgi:hypothetical protein